MTKGTQQPPFSIRLAPELMARLEAAAKADMRSVSSEIAKRLHLSFETPKDALRDQFAMASLPAILDGSWPDLMLSPSHKLSPIENSAKFAYEVADAMLRARGE